ncbi:hypothetical protein M9Y10_014272 [Tritrichomonas musculus]|uniref:Uncharacterized protein n=1 Tax=Tritrichomonas musculus TaxID=1915356 RepID=A0ABR2KZ51_9EUKA
MCKEVDNDTGNSEKRGKVQTRGVKILPASEEPISIPQDNQFMPPKHQTAYNNDEFQIDGSAIEEVSLSNLEASDNHQAVNIQKKENSKESPNTYLSEDTSKRRSKEFSINKNTRKKTYSSSSQNREESYSNGYTSSSYVHYSSNSDEYSSTNSDS